MNIPKETATVYKANGRRYLSKDKAYKAQARAKINTRCECDYGANYGGGRYGGDVCFYHHDEQRLKKLTYRLARWYRHLDKREPSE